MAWIESHQELARHPKVKKAARLLGIHRAQMLGHLHALWWHAVDVADGDTLDIEWHDLAEEALWDNDPDTFIKALIDAGWLHQLDGHRLRLHDWWDYAGKTVVAANARKADGILGAHRRWHRDGVTDPSCPHCPGTDPGKNPPTTGPNSPPNDPPNRLGMGGLMAQDTQDTQDTHTPQTPHDPTSTDTAHRLACVWNRGNTPSDNLVATAQRTVAAIPQLDELTQRQLERLTAWAREQGTRTLGGLPHTAPAWNGWPTIRPPDPPWCGDCDQATRILPDDTNTGQPCPTCHPTRLDLDNAIGATP